MYMNSQRDSYLLTNLFKTLSHGIHCDTVGLRSKCHLFRRKGALNKIRRTAYQNKINIKMCDIMSLTISK